MNGQIEDEFDLERACWARDCPGAQELLQLGAPQPEE